MSLPKTYDVMEPQYNLRAGRPDYDTAVVPAWIARSERARQTLRARVDVAYGEGAREKLDFFSCGDAGAPLLIYFHGGFWQRGDKSVYGFLAEPFVAEGVNVAIVNYDLCPAVRISAITPQARKAVAWIWRHAGDLGFDRDRVFVMGHSAGGHITAMIMATDWPSIDPSLPADLVKGGVPISGLFELDPLRYSSINDGVRMDADEAERESPLNHLPTLRVPQLIVYGARETDEFRRQSHRYAAALAERGWDVAQYAVPDCDHFDELNALADPGSEFFRQSLALIRRPTGASTGGSPTMALLDRIVEAFNSHDVEALGRHFAEHAEMRSAAGPDIWGTRIHGRDAILAALAGRFAATPDIRWQDGRNWIVGDRAVSEWRVTFTQADGTRVDQRGCDLYRFDGGKIVLKDVYYKQVVRG